MVPEKIELRHRLFVTSRPQRLVLGAAAFLVAAILFLMVFILFQSVPAEQRSWARFVEKVFHNGTRNLVDAVLAAGLLVYALIAWHIGRRERLVLSSEGIEFRSGLPEWLASLRPSWRIRWQQLRSVTIRKSPMVHGPQGAILELVDGARKRRVAPAMWVDPRSFKPTFNWRGQLAGAKVRQAWLRAEVENSAILRYLRQAAPQVQVIGLEGTESDQFALEKHPRSKGILIATALLLGYATLDAVVFSETYVEMPRTILLQGGLIGAIGAAMWMRRGRVPAAESIGVGLVFGLMVGVALYPGLLRANALTDRTGLRHYEYRLDSRLTLRPPEPGLPVLNFPDAYEYWVQHEKDSVHVIELRRGGLGFYQINMAPLQQRWRDFYRDHPRQLRKPGSR